VIPAVILTSHPGPIYLLIMPEMHGRNLAQCLSSVRPKAKSLDASGHRENATNHNGSSEAGVNPLSQPLTLSTLTVKVRETNEKLSPRRFSCLLVH
jgi:hypothetical protein